MSSAPGATNEYLSKKYVDGVYIPSGLLVVGCLIVKREWVPYAVVLALALSGFKIWSGSTQSNVKGRFAIANTIHRSPGYSQTRCIPKFRAEGEDNYFTQCGDVRILLSVWLRNTD